MLKRFPLFLSALLILTITAFSGQITHQLNFSPPSVIIADDLTYLQMDNCQIAGEPGQPAIPACGVQILLPPGEAITSIDVITSELIITATGVALDPIQQPVIISFPGPITPTQPDPAIYNSDDLFPAQLAQGVQTQYMCGYSIGYFRVYPIQYRPQSGEISYYPNITIKVNTAPSPDAIAAHSQNYRGIESDRLRLIGKVDNPDYAENYGPIINNNLTDDPVIPYLIITTSAMVDAFNPLIEFKNTCGYITEVVYVDYITSTYPGYDNPERIRNCIIDYYLNNSTSYVLLAGDDEFLQHRGLYASLAGETDPDIAGDIYFAGLDGTWDNDNDHIYGESGEADLVAEVIVGRAAVDTYNEAANFVNKQMMYQTEPVASELETALMIGEDLGWITWGSDLKEEIRLGTYYTAGFPPNFYVATLYDTPGWSFSAFNDLLPLLNLGPNLVNHMGHANTTYMMKFNKSSVNTSNMTNNGINHNFYIVYSQGCYCGSFDNRNPGGSYTSDSITEEFNNIATGAVCMITNSRYGWGDYSGTNGPSQYYDRQFFDALFGENISRIGEVNQDSKEDNIPYISNATYWCYYQLNLFGDPTLDIWTSEPMDMNPAYNPTIFVGQSEYTLQVPGVMGAYCALSDESGLLGTAHTNPMGEATITFEPIASLDTLTLAITAHNYFPFITDVVVITPNMPYIVVDEITINDSEFGDGDGILDLGEHGFLAVDFYNVGLIEAEDVNAEIYSDDDYVIILNTSIALGNIPPETIVEVSDAFEIEVYPDVEDGHTFAFIITMYDSQDSVWVQNFEFDITAPEIVITNVLVDDGDDMRLAPGETADIIITLANQGSGELLVGEGELTTDNPYIYINNSISYASLITGGQSTPLEPAFNLTVDENCPDNSAIPFYLEVNDLRGYQRFLLFEITVGGFFDNFENGQGDWTHDICSPGYSDEWHMNTYRNYSINGATSWHIGAPSGGQYSGQLDGGLRTPWLIMEGDGMLTFWHWMDAETSSTYQGQCYDGGLVELTYDGSVFLQIFPQGNYPFAIREGSVPGPFAPNTYVFSGRHNWKYEAFDLSLYPSDTVQFRFRFGSDSLVTAEGWYIDDFDFLIVPPNNPPSNFQASLEENIVHLTWNSPAPPPILSKDGTRNSETLLSYIIYRDSQVLADNIQTLEYYDDLTGMPSGEYSYQAATLYSNGQSALTPAVIIGFPSVSVPDGTASIPDEFFLDQNYPNPFNPETNFRFGLPEGCDVDLTIYNITGQEVISLIDGFKPAGYYTIPWKADALPTGIYIYRMNAGDFQSIGKMLLLK